MQILAKHCLAAGQAALARAADDEETIAALRMAVDSSWITGIVKQWWIKFRHLAPQWSRDGDLETWCEGFVFLLQSGVKTPPPGVDSQEYQWVTLHAFSCSNRRSLITPPFSSLEHDS